MTIAGWSTTPASNATVLDATYGDINFAEGQTPASVNNSNRSVMAHVRAWYNGLFPTLAVSTNTTLDADDANSLVQVDTSSGNVTITLPAVAGTSGRAYVIRKDDAANILTVAAQGAELINSSNTLSLTSNTDTVFLISDGVIWSLVLDTRAVTNTGYSTAQSLRDAGTPSTGSIATTKGALAEGDRGGGEWWWNSASTETDDTGAILLPTGHTGAGRWERLIKGRILHVDWWGNDGIDIGPTIQAALDWCYQVGYGYRGYEILLPPGLLPIQTTVTLGYRSVTLSGSTLGYEGSALHTGLVVSANIVGNIIEVTGDSSTEGVMLRNFAIFGDHVPESSATGTYVVSGYCLYLRDFNRGVLENIRLARVNGGGLYVNRCIKSHMANVDIQHVGKKTSTASTCYAMYAAYVTDEQRVQGGQMYNFKLEHNYSEPMIYLDGETNISDLTTETAVDSTLVSEQHLFINRRCNISDWKASVTNNVSGGGNAKCRISSNATGVIISDSSVLGESSGPQILVEGRQAQLDNIQFSNCGGGNSIKLLNTADFTSITGCSFFSSGGIYVDGASYVNISGNEFMECTPDDTGQTGYITTVSATYSTIKNNNINDTGQAKNSTSLTSYISAAGEGTKIDGNQCSSNDASIPATFNGIQVTGLTAGSITNNDIRRCGQYGIYNNESGTHMISGNNLSVVGSHGIYIYSTSIRSAHMVVSGNSITATGDALRMTDTAGLISAGPSHTAVCVTGNNFGDTSVNIAGNGYTSTQQVIVASNIPPTANEITVLSIPAT